MRPVSLRQAGFLPGVLMLLLSMTAPHAGADTQALTQLASHNSVPARGCSGACWPAAVEVRGSGFQPAQQDQYRCRFRGSADGSFLEREVRFPAEEEGPVTSFARVVSDSVITCSIGSSSALPMYSSQYFRVEVLFQNSPVQWSDQASSEILFREIWAHTDCAGGACRGSAAGGSTFRVYGAGFNASNTYSCDFQAGPHRASAAATVISHVQLECRVPAWPAEHGRVGFAVSRSTGSNSSSPISFGGALAAAQEFTYYASWWFEGQPEGSVLGGVGATTPAPARADANTPMLTVRGAGFDQSAVYYASLYGLDVNGNQLQVQTASSETVVVSSSEIRLLVPPFSGPEGFATVQLWACVEGSCQVVDAVEQPRFRYVASWNRVSMDAVSGPQDACFPHGPVQCWGAASGGSSVRILGDGFNPSSTFGIYYRCKFSLESDPDVFELSAPVIATSQQQVVCTTPAWVRAQGVRADVSVQSEGIDGTHAVPLHPQFSKTSFFFQAVATSLSPDSGLASSAIVTIHGIAFLGSYACEFSSANASGLAWLPEQSVQVPATVISDRALRCNASDLWGTQFPAGVAAVSVLQVASLSLAAFVDVSARSLSLGQDYHAADRSVMLGVQPGLYVKIGGEKLLVTGLQSNRTVAVERGSFDTDAVMHVSGSQVHLYASLGEQAQLSYTIRPSYAVSMAPSQLAAGMPPIPVRGYGFEATVLRAQHTLSTLASSAQLFSLQADVGGASGAVLPGIMFDIYADREIIVRGFDLAVASAGNQLIWVYARNTSQCESRECGSRGYELHHDAWQLITPDEGVNVTVNTSLVASVSVSHTSVGSGQTRGFVLFAKPGIRYGGATAARAGCLGGGKACAAWEGVFAKVFGGHLVQGLVGNSPASAAPSVFVQSWGDQENPRYFAGVVHYDNVQVGGRLYSCKLEAPSGEMLVSEPAYAFARSSQQVAFAKPVLCLFPPWPYQEGLVSLSVFETATGAVIVDATGAESIPVELLSSWVAAVGPVYGSPLGGQALTVYGIGLLGGGYRCRFRSASPTNMSALANMSVVGSELQEADALVNGVRTTVHIGQCVVPAWSSKLGPQGFTVTYIDLLRGDDSIVPWTPFSEMVTMPYEVGNAGGLNCSGLACLGSSGGLYQCQNYSCGYISVHETADYAGRMFTFHEMLLSKLVPYSGPADGGTEIAGAGAGFDVTWNSTYWCGFSMENGALWIAASAVTLSEIKCRTPSGTNAWGSNFRAEVSRQDARGRPGLLNLFRVTGRGMLNGTCVNDICVLTGFPGPDPNASPNSEVAFVQMGGELIAVEMVGPRVIASNIAASAVRLTRRGLFGTIPTDLSTVRVVHFYKQVPQNDSCTREDWGSGACPAQVPANAFTFITMWKSVFPATSVAGVAVNLTISGSGFDTTRKHYANFSNGSDWVVSESAYPSSTTRLVLPAPRWNAGSATAQVYIYSVPPPCATSIPNVSHSEGVNGTLVATAGGQPCNGTGWCNSSCAIACFTAHAASQSDYIRCILEPVPQVICRTGELANCERAPAQTYTFKAAWYAVQNRPARVIFPVQLIIKGVAFHTGPSGYTCRFRPKGLSSNSLYFDTPADAVDLTTLACSAPEWTYKRLTYGVLEVLYNGEAIDYAGVQNLDQLFFTDGWGAVSSDTGGLVGPANGGTVLQFSGAGFDRSKNYTCVFSRDELEMRSNASVLSTVLIQCTTPNWGAKYASGNVNLGLAWMNRTLPNDCELSQSCFFRFATQWQHVQPMKVDASGGDDITVTGFGFEADASYLCVLSDGTYSINATGMVLSPLELVCTLPPWRYQASHANFSVVQLLAKCDGWCKSACISLCVKVHGANHSNYMLCVDKCIANSSLAAGATISLIPSASNTPLRVELLSGWTAHNRTKGAAKGGDVILIDGFGFDASSSSYVCEFTYRDTGVSSAAAAAVLSDVQLVCKSSWPHEAALTVLSLRKAHTPVPFRNATAMQPFFQYREGWDRSVPMSVPASGGSEIKVQGYGFKVGGNYSCQFSSPADGTMTVMAVAVNLTELRCETPPWGAQYSGADPDVVGGRDISLNILRGARGALVDFTDGGLAPLAPLQGAVCAGHACWFEFYTNWLSASVNGSSMAGNAGGTQTDGTQVLVVGGGFNTNGGYSCRFETDSTSLWTSAHVSAVDLLVCDVPEWPGQAESARFTVWHRNHTLSTLSNTSNASITLPGPTNVVLEYYAVWQTVSVSSVYAGGGSEVLVQGYGFKSTLQYKCKFDFIYRNSSYRQPWLLMDDEKVSHEMHTAATVVSSKQLSCLAPAWEFPGSHNVSHTYGEFSVVVGSSLVPFVSMQGLGEHIPFEFRAGWDGLVQPTTASSGGGIMLTLTGYGFDKTSEDYECIFGASPASNHSSRAKALDSTTVVCEAYPIGKHLSVREARLWLRDSEGLVSQSRAEFLFYSVWNDTTPSVASAAGGETVTVNGFGFDAATTYKCVFRSDSGAAETNVSAIVVSSTALACVTSPWNAPTTEGAWLSVVSGEYAMPMYLSADMRRPFGFAPEWNAKSVKADLAKGGEPITISGHGFELSTTVSYVCAFSACLSGCDDICIETCVKTAMSYEEHALCKHQCAISSGQNATNVTRQEAFVTAEATVLNRYTLTCITPHWHYAAGPAMFSILRSGSGPEVMTNAQTDIIFTFFEGWDTPSRNSPATGGAGGMDILWIQGYGFDKGRNYSCVFFRPSTLSSSCSGDNYASTCPSVSLGIDEMSSRAVVHNSTTLSCYTVPWGIRYTAHHPTWTANVPDDYTGLTAYELRREGALVNFTDGNAGLGSAEVSWRQNRDAWFEHCAFHDKPCSFRFVVSWTADGAPLEEGVHPATTPSIFPAGGGHQITISGFGFRSDRQYLCAFEYFRDDVLLHDAYSLDVDETWNGLIAARVAASQENLNTLICLTPVWAFKEVANASLKVVIDYERTILQELGEVMPESQAPFLVQFTHGILRVEPTSVSAKGGTLLTVFGFGFDLARGYSCNFNGQDSPAQPSLDFDQQLYAGRFDEVEYFEVVCPVPQWPIAANASNVTMRYTDSNTSELSKHLLSVYEFPMNQTTMSSVSITELQHINIEYYPEWIAQIPGYGDRFGALDGGRSPAITITGAGFRETSTYLCRFRASDYVPDGPNASLADGTQNSTSVSSDQLASVGQTWLQSVAEYIHVQALICIPPTWDNTTMWSDYHTQYVDFYIYEKKEGSSDYERMRAVNGTGQRRVPGEVPYEYVHVNKKPRFVGTRFVTIPGDLDTYTHVNWTTFLRKGETYDFEHIAVEDDQPVTYVVSVAGVHDKLFDTLPAIDADGTMTVKSKPGAYGRALISVYVQDGGGRMYGGDDQSFRAAFEVSIMPAADIPAWQVGGVISVPEDDDDTAVVGNFLYRFFTDFSNGPVEFFQLFSFSVVSDSTYVRQMIFSPNYDYGSAADLFIESPPFVFGNSSIELTLYVRDIRTQDISTVAKNMTLTIFPVNNAPSFSVLGPVAVNEIRMCQMCNNTCMQGCVKTAGAVSAEAFAQCMHQCAVSSNTNARYCVPLATDILKGPNTTAPVGPKGEDWAENSQMVSFHVALVNGSSTVLLENSTTVSPDGTLCFTPEPYRNGNLTFSIFLVDDGGVDRGGVDTSLLSTFAVTILPVNDKPTFGINTSACEANAGIMNCLPECGDGNFSRCTVALSVSQNCADCPNASPKAPSCQYPFVLEHFVTNAHQSFVYSPDEESQRLEFVLETTQGAEAALFEVYPQIDAEGTLTFCISKDQTGNMTLNVTLTDDGGIERGGQDRSEVATLEISVELVNVRPTFELCDAGTIIVWQGTGSHSVPGFAFDIYRGQRLANNEDVEAGQKLTFSIVAPSVSASPVKNSSLFLHVNGTLDFTLLPSVTGMYPVRIFATDDGGQDLERGGADTSDYADLNFFVVGSYVQLDVEVSNTGPTALSAEEARQNVTAAIAAALGVNIPGMIRSGGFGVKLNHTHMLRLFDGPRCNRSAVGQDQQFLAVHTKANFSIVVVSTSLQRVLDYGSSMSNVTSTLAASSGPLDAALLSYSMHTLDAAAVASFDLQSNQQGTEANFNGIPRITVKENSGISEDSNPNVPVDNFGAATVTMLSGSADSTLLLSVISFVTNISLPPDVEVDLDGSQIVRFDVVPVAYRLFNQDSFVNTDAGKTGGMMDGVPFVSASCTPQRMVGYSVGSCIDANMTLGSMAQYFNGQIRYEVRMRKSLAVREFVLDVLPVNQAPILRFSPVYSLLEAGPEGRNVSVDGFVEFSLGAPVDDEEVQSISFSLVPISGLSGDGFFTSTPRMVPAANGTATLEFELAPFINGNISFVVTAHDDGLTLNGGRNLSAPYSFVIQILPVNTHPYFYLSCSESFTICNPACGLGHENITQCAATLALLEDCRNCPDPGPGISCPDGVRPLVLPGFMPSQTSFANASHEGSQASSFQLIAVSGSAELLSVGPNVSTSDGTLTLCLRKIAVGSVDFEVWMRDDGGTANGGESSYGPIKLTVSAGEVNQKPSFQVCSTGGIPVWKGSERHVVPGFVLMNTVRNGDEDGKELEPNQNLTFIVTTPNSTVINSSSLHVDSGGALSFQLFPDAAGEAVLQIVAKDDGGTERGGVDTSDVTEVRIFVVASILQFDVESDHPNLFDENSADLRAAILHSFRPPQPELPASLIVVDEDAGTASASELNSASFCSRAGAGSGRRLLQQASFSIRILELSLADAIARRDANGTSNLESTIQSAFPGASTNLTRTSVYTTDASRTANFTFALPKFKVDEFEGPAPSTLVNITNFISSIVAPFNVEVDANGVEQVAFDVVPVAYRLFDEHDFVENPTGDLVTGIPSVSVSCVGARDGNDPAGRCTSADVGLFSVHQYLNGEVRYQVTMRGLSVIKYVILEVVPVDQAGSFEMPSQLTVREGLGDEETVVRNFAFNLIAGPKFSATNQLVVDEQKQRLAFNVTLVQGDASMFVQTPALIHDEDSLNATLVFLLRRGKHGSAQFAVTGQNYGPGASTPGAETQTHFLTLTVISVNQAPSFRLSQPNFTVYQDVVDRVVVINNVAIDIMRDAGDGGEKDQSLVFELTVTGDAVVALDPAPHMYPNGSLVFTASKMLLGTVHFDVRLLDSGGSADGGDNSSSVASFSISVVQRNYPPVFNVSMPLVRQCENAGFVSATVFKGIMKAWHPLLHEQESDQDLTFDLKPLNDGSQLFATAPSVSDTGVLTFATAMNRFGNATFNVTLRDNGRDVDPTFESLSSQQWARLTIEILPNNDAPSFSVAPGMNLIVKPEAAIAKLHVIELFATDILAGLNLTAPFGDQAQNLTFEVTALRARVPGRPGAPWVPNPADLMTDSDDSQLFMSDPGVIVRRDGTLIFKVAPLKNGQAEFQVQLRDDGDDARCGGSGVSSPHTFFINIESQNDPPNFALSTNGVVLARPMGAPLPSSTTTWTMVNETGQAHPIFKISETSITSMVTVQDVLVDVTTGGWDEWDQGLRFKAELIAGDETIASELDLVDGGPSDTCLQSGMPTSQCSRTAHLTLKQERHRFGSVTLRLSVFDTDTSALQEGTNLKVVTVVLQIVPVNDAPMIRLSTQDVVVSSAGGCLDVLPHIDTLNNVVVELGLGTSPTPHLAQHYTKAAVEGVAFMKNLSHRLSHSGGMSVLVELAQPCAPVCNDSQASAGLSNCTEATSDTMQCTLRVGSCKVSAVSSEFLRASMEALLITENTNLNVTVSRVAIAAAHVRPCDTNIFVHEYKGLVSRFTLGTNEDAAWNSCQDSTCEGQNATFSVMPLQEAEFHRIFATPPQMLYPCGTLIFQVHPYAYGSVLFQVTLTDDNAYDGSSLTSIPINITIHIKVGNQPPAFTSRNLDPIFENSGAHVLRAVATNISADGGLNLADESAQLVTFHVETEQDWLFSVQPSMSVDGDLSFTLAPGRFGIANLSVVLLDDGGTVNLGRNRSQVHYIPLQVLHVNIGPSFAVENIFVTKRCRPLLTTTSGFCHDGKHLIRSFVQDSIPGPPSEQCTSESSNCVVQNVVYIVDDVSNPALFMVPPSVSTNGALSFELAPDVTGSTEVVIRAEDDGGERPEFPDFPGTNSSRRYTFTIFVESYDYPPAFRLPWNVTCLTTASSGSGRCTCPSPFSRSFSTSSLCGNGTWAGNRGGAEAETTVSVLEGTGLQEIENFATHITAAKGFMPGKVAHFEMPSLPTSINYGDGKESPPPLQESMPAMTFDAETYEQAPLPDLRFVALESDPLAALENLGEFVYDYAVDPEEKHVYAIEKETDAITILDVMSGGIDHATIIDRRADDEKRLRFGGFSDYPSFQSDTKTVQRGSICGLSPLPAASGEQLLVPASGCQLLDENRDHVYNGTCRAEFLTASCDLACCQDLVRRTAGHWDLTAASLHARHKLSRHDSGEQVNCTEFSCTYSRPKITGDAECNEQHATRFGPAAFQDLSGKMGSAVLKGAGKQCKKEDRYDWDQPESLSLNAKNFLVNNGEVEAVQFDGKLNPGLTVATSLEDFYDADPAESVLAHNGISVEAWFTIEEIPTTPQESGLIGSILTDAGVCNRGFQLTHKAGRTDTQYQFQLALQTVGASSAASSSFASIKHNTGSKIQVGEWHHLVATYGDIDASRRSYLHLYLDGELMQESSKACNRDADAIPCGRILYPVAAHKSPGCDGKAHLTIGTVYNPMGARTQYFPHVGMIKSARIFQRALSGEEVAHLYAIMAPTLRSFVVPEGEYWVKGETRFNQVQNRWVGSISPTGDYNYVERNTSFLIRGRFFKDTRNYTCELRYGDIVVESKTALIQCTAIDLEGTWPGLLNNEHLEVGTESCDYMVCEFGAWDHGWAAARVRINSYRVDQHGVQRLQPLWQRACLRQICGFPVWKFRFPDATSTYKLDDDQVFSFFPIQRGTNKQMDTGLVGDFTYFRFLTRTSIYVFNETGESLEHVADLNAYERNATTVSPVTWVNMTYLNSQADPVINVTFDPNDETTWPIQYFPLRNHTVLTGRWGLRTCSHPSVISASNTDGIRLRPLRAYANESSAELLKWHLRRCQSDDQCPGDQVCESDDSYRIVGAVSVTPFHHLGVQHMIVANFWDGLTSHVGSAIYRYDVNFTGAQNAGSALRSLQFVQIIPTKGARKWAHVLVCNEPVLVVASFSGPSSAFLLENSADMAVNTLRGSPIGQAGVSSMVTFTAGSGTYVVFAALTDGAAGHADSHILRLGLAHNHSHSDFGDGLLEPHDPKFRGIALHPVTARIVQMLPTRRVHDVELFEIEGYQYLAFASLSESGPSVIYRRLKSSSAVSFSMHQALEVSNSVSLHFVPGVVPCLFVGKQAGDSTMLHWNGSLFLGVNNATTAPADSAGGQFFRTYNAQDIITLRRAGVVAHGTGSPRLLSQLNYTDYLFLGNFRRPQPGPRPRDTFRVNYEWSQQDSRGRRGEFRAC